MRVAISPSVISFLMTSGVESPSDSATSFTVAPELTFVGGSSLTSGAGAFRSGSTHGVLRRRPRRRGGWCCIGGGAVRREAWESITTRRRRPAPPGGPASAGRVGRVGRCGGASRAG